MNRYEIALLIVVGFILTCVVASAMAIDNYKMEIVNRCKYVKEIKINGITFVCMEWYNESI